MFFNQLAEAGDNVEPFVSHSILLYSRNCLGKRAICLAEQPRNLGWSEDLAERDGTNSGLQTTAQATGINTLLPTCSWGWRGWSSRLPACRGMFIRLPRCRDNLLSFTPTTNHIEPDNPTKSSNNIQIAKTHPLTSHQFVVRSLLRVCSSLYLYRRQLGFLPSQYKDADLQQPDPDAPFLSRFSSFFSFGGLSVSYSFASGFSLSDPALADSDWSGWRLFRCNWRRGHSF